MNFPGMGTLFGVFVCVLVCGSLYARINLSCVSLMRKGIDAVVVDGL